MTAEEAKKIEDCTRGQASSPRWFKERKWRLTASNFGQIVKSTERRDFSSLCDTLLNPPKISTRPIIHGKTCEPIAIEKFESLTNKKVQKCGLFINESFPNFAATPDGLIDNDKIIEVKCPFTARNDMICDTSVSFLEMSTEGNLQLKKET